MVRTNPTEETPSNGRESSYTEPLPQLLALDGIDDIDDMPSIMRNIALIQLAQTQEIKTLMQALGEDSVEAKIITHIRTNLTGLQRRHPQGTGEAIMTAHQEHAPEALQLNPQTIVDAINTKCQRVQSPLRMVQTNQDLFTLNTTRYKTVDNIPPETQEAHEKAVEVLETLNPFSTQHRVLAQLVYQYWGVQTQSLRKTLGLTTGTSLTTQLAELRRKLAQHNITIINRNSVAYIAPLNAPKTQIINPEKTYESYRGSVETLDKKILERTWSESPLTKVPKENDKFKIAQELSRAGIEEIEAAKKVLSEDSDVNRAILQAFIQSNPQRRPILENKARGILTSLGYALPGNQVGLTIQQTEFLNTQLLGTGVAIENLTPEEKRITKQIWGAIQTRVQTAPEEDVMGRLQQMHKDVLQADIRNPHTRTVCCLIQQYWGIEISEISRQSRMTNQSVIIDLQRFSNTVLSDTPYEIVIRNDIAILAYKDGPILIPTTPEKESPPPTPTPTHTPIHSSLIPNTPTTGPRQRLRMTLDDEYTRAPSPETPLYTALQEEIEALQTKIVDLENLVKALGIENTRLREERSDLKREPRRIIEKLRLQVTAGICTMDAYENSLASANRLAIDLRTQIAKLKAELARANTRPTFLINIPAQKQRKTAKKLATPITNVERSGHIETLTQDLSPDSPIQIITTNTLTSKTQGLHNEAADLATEKEEAFLLLLTEEYWGIKRQAILDCLKIKPEMLDALIQEVNENILEQKNIQIIERNGILILGDTNGYIEIPVPPPAGTPHEYTKTLREEAKKLQPKKPRTKAAISGKVLAKLLEPPHNFTLLTLAEMAGGETEEKAIQKVKYAIAMLRQKIKNTNAHLKLIESKGRISMVIPPSPKATAIAKDPRERIRAILERSKKSKSKDLLRIMYNHPEGIPLKDILDLLIIDLTGARNIVHQLNKNHLEPIDVRITESDGRLHFQYREWQFANSQQTRAEMFELDPSTLESLAPEDEEPEEDEEDTEPIEHPVNPSTIVKPNLSPADNDPFALEHTTLEDIGYYNREEPLTDTEDTDDRFAFGSELLEDANTREQELRDRIESLELEVTLLLSLLKTETQKPQ